MHEATGGATRESAGSISGDGQGYRSHNPHGGRTV